MDKIVKDALTQSRRGHRERLDRINRMNMLKIFCLSGRKEKGPIHFKTDTSRSLMEARRANLVLKRTFSKEKPYGSFILKLKKIPTDHVNPV
jgi:hypothetical protein